MGEIELVRIGKDVFDRGERDVMMLFRKIYDSRQCDCEILEKIEKNKRKKTRRWKRLDKV